MLLAVEKSPSGIEIPSGGNKPDSVFKFAV